MKLKGVLLVIHRAVHTYTIDSTKFSAHVKIIQINEHQCKPIQHQQIKEIHQASMHINTTSMQINENNEMYELPPLPPTSPITTFALGRAGGSLAACQSNLCLDS